MAAWIHRHFLIDADGRFAALEGLRALAMLLVFNVHWLVSYDWNRYMSGDDAWLVPVYKTLRAGHIGVDLFFILSGFLIFRTLVNNRPGFFYFIRRRYARIFPVVLVTTIPMLGGQSLIGIFDNLSLLQLGNTGYLNFVAWTLSYEVYFYLIMAVWLLVLGPWLASGWAGFVIVSTAVITAHYMIEPKVLIETPRFFAFFFGVLLAKLYQEKALWNGLAPLFRHGWLPALIVVVLAMYWWGQNAIPGTVKDMMERTLFYLIVDSAFLVLVASMLVGKTAAGRFFASLPLRFLGTISYSFYMIHALWALPLAGTFISGIPNGAGKLFAHGGLALLVSVMLAAFMFYYLERPYFKRR